MTKQELEKQCEKLQAENTRLQASLNQFRIGIEELVFDYLQNCLEVDTYSNDDDDYWWTKVCLRNPKTGISERIG